MRTLLKLLFLFFIFSLFFVLPNVLIPLEVKMGKQSEYNALMLVVLLLTNFAVIIYLIKRLHLWGLKLFSAVVVTYWGLQTFMTQLETWYFREAMPSITNTELINLFVRPFITSITFIPLAILMLGKWKRNTISEELTSRIQLNWQNIVILSAAYVVIYFAFGHFVAWQFEEVRIFYSGRAENIGFVGQITKTAEEKSFIFLFQFLRGFAWIIAGLPIVLYLKGSKNEKLIACGVLYSLTAIQLIVDNPFMPQQVRVAHLLEVASSNALFGLLIGYFSISTPVDPSPPTRTSDDLNLQSELDAL